jgi:hypothetical protein
MKGVKSESRKKTLGRQIETEEKPQGAEYVSIQVSETRVILIGYVVQAELQGLASLLLDDGEVSIFKID